MCKQFRSHSVFDGTSLSLERLREMKITWDNEESDQRKALTKMLVNMKELIKEQEEKHSNAFKVRRLSVLDTSEMAKVQCDTIGFQNIDDNGMIIVGSLLEGEKMDNVTNDKVKGETTFYLITNVKR